MSSDVLIGLVIGLFLGAGITGAIVASFGRAARATGLAEVEMRRAAAETLLEEVRLQLANAKEECDAVREQKQLAENRFSTARAHLLEREASILKQKALLDQAEEKLSATFNSLAAQALANNNQGFLVLAEQSFGSIKQEATADLEARKVAIDAIVKPVRETLASYQQETKALEEKRLKEIGAVGEQLRTVAATEALLQKETNQLVNALRAPQVRGRWGELTLRRSAELAGMTLHVDFAEQESFITEDGRHRPDMTVKLPAERDVFVDSKVPLAAFLEALAAQTAQQRATALEKHSKLVKGHVDALSKKEYWASADGPDFVVLFIPGDSFLAAALEADPEIVEYALRKKVAIATPTTLVALLRVIEFGWQERTALENALEIRALGQELGDRVATLVEHLNRVGGALGKAVECYNAAMGSVNDRIVSTSRKFKALGAGGKKDIESIEVVDATPRILVKSDAESNENK